MKPVIVNTGEEMGEALGLPGDLEGYDNHWVRTLRMKGLEVNAFNLMDLMRPEVEKILVLCGVTTPPSQEMRVRECIEEINRKYDVLRERQDDCADPKLSMRQRMSLWKTRKFLEDFLAVHKAVWILEGKPV